ncbi:MAG: NAD-dependent epimerase/dehydratase family protein [Planctomycetota bacterium]|jgi:nucleoside-diphosphate-sugar epimerase
MRILILGGTAFIGPPTVRRLHEEGNEIALFHRGKTEADIPDGVKHILGDRQHFPDFVETLRAFRPDIVLDMFPLSENDARSVLDAFRGVAGRVVAVSSMDVYRAYGILTGKESGGLEPVPLTEESPVRETLYPYRGVSERLHDYEKILVERTILDDPDLPGTVLRLPMVFGPRDYQHRLFPYLKRMDDGRPFILLGKGQAAWRCTRGYVENVSAGIALSVLNDAGLGRIYNVGDEKAFTEADWVKAVGRAAEWEGEVVVLPEDHLPAHLKEGSNTAQHLAASTARIREDLKYTDAVPLEEALVRTVAWERSHPPKGVEASRFDYAAEDEASRRAREER